MLARQIDAPDDPARHGALTCPTDGRVHGRCMDAVYPFVHRYRVTGDEKYLTAARSVMAWAEANVAQPDGSWTVMPNPKTWRGISVFGAIALAETLHHHGDILPADLRQEWTDRLARVGEYLLANFNLTFTNINYGFTALQAFVLIGEVLNEPKYTARAQELGKEAKQWFTEPHALLYGEGKPSTARSPKGLLPVDLGYNVEESLNGITYYALHTGDEELLDLLTTSLQSHLAFMLPDGGWDNSWGTRQAKWTYWGSRTTDGSQLAYAMLADRDPAFATAAVRTTELLERCTADNGLLYGGLHYAEHEVPPCIHHTFAHAKPLAALLDGDKTLTSLTATAPLPRAVADGIQHFPETDVWLLARGPWRATVSTYDFIYKKYCFQGTGGALNVLWHEAVGPLFLASMAEYQLVEKFNQQPDPDGEEFALTPRLEVTTDGNWYTNLYDLTATVVTRDEGGTLFTEVSTRPHNREGEALPEGPERWGLRYKITADEVRISVPQATKPLPAGSRLVLPLISASTERVERLAPNRIRIHKPGALVTLEADQPLEIAPSKRSRVFNMVPGAQALPIVVSLTEGAVNCRLTLSPKN